MAIQTILDYSTWFGRQLDTGTLVPCVRECRNYNSNMSGLVCTDLHLVFSQVTGFGPL